MSISRYSNVVKNTLLKAPDWIIINNHLLNYIYKVLILKIKLQNLHCYYIGRKMFSYKHTKI